MTRGLLIITACLLLSGCASKATKPVHVAQPVIPAEDEAVAAALVFQPPITYGQPSLHLDRDERAASVFMGYEELTTQFYYLRTVDRQMDGEREEYDRRAVSEKVGVSYR